MENANNIKDINNEPLQIGWAYTDDNSQIYICTRIQADTKILIWMIGPTRRRAFDGNGAWQEKQFTPITDLATIMNTLDNKLQALHREQVKEKVK